jgi:hypothetical protein
MRRFMAVILLAVLVLPAGDADAHEWRKIDGWWSARYVDDYVWKVLLAAERTNPLRDSVALKAICVFKISVDVVVDEDGIHTIYQKMTGTIEIPAGEGYAGVKMGRVVRFPGGDEPLVDFDMGNVLHCHKV